ncbi:MAG: 2-dehydro-3-deoxygalactonokinase [Pseudomonadota bacterium]
MREVTWIGADWGTTNLRLFAMDDHNQVMTQQKLASGFGSLTPREFESHLRKGLHAWDLPKHTTIIACGMVGARTGWIEAPYQETPAFDIAQDLTKAPTSSPALEVWIAPGICQMNPCDVMRGEETQIAGFLMGNPKFAGQLCLPGTHSKWVKIDHGVIQNFRTVMTGELFGLLIHHSSLQNAIDPTAWDDATFLQALHEGANAPQMINTNLFGVRAENLLQTQPACALARLSGLLVGGELAAYKDTQSVIVIGDSEISARYHMGMKALGIDAEIYDGTEMVIKGLIAAYERHKHG